MSQKTIFEPGFNVVESASSEENLPPKKQPKSNLEKLNGEGNFHAGFAKVTQDLSERRASEEMLWKLARSLEYTADSVFIVSPLGKIEYVNSAFQKLTGYKKEEVIGKSPNLLKSGLHSEKFYGDLWKKINSGKVFRAVFTNKKKNGDLYFEDQTITPILDEKDRIVYFVVTARDITKQKGKSDQLKLFSEAIENAPDGVQIVDLDGKILYSNKAIERIYGFSKKEFQGEHVNEMNADSTFASRVIIPHIQKFGHWTGELEVKHKDGNTFPIWLTSSMVKDKKGEPMALVGIIRDISDLRRSQQRLSLQYSATKILAESPNLEKATADLLKVIGKNLGWELGEFWIWDEKTELLSCHKIWHEKGLDTNKFESVTSKISFPANTGVPGKILASRKPMWVEDVNKEPAFKKTSIAAALDLHAAFGFPILFGGKVLGVMLFFTRQIIGKDKELLKTMHSIGTQMGQFMERKRAEEELIKSESWLSDIVDNTSASIYAKDLNGRYILFNKKSESLIGMPRSKVLGKTVYNLFPKVYADEISKNDKRVLEAQVPLEFEETIEMGGQFLTTISVKFLLYDAAGKPFALCGISTDITDRKKKEKEKEFQVKASNVLSLSLNHETILKNLASLVVPNLADWCTIDLVEGGGIRRLIAVSADKSKRKLAEALEAFPPIEAIKCPVIKTIETGKAQYEPRVSDETLACFSKKPEILRVLKALRVVSMIVVPLKVRQKIIGAISLVYGSSGRIYTQDDLLLAEDLASRAALSVDNALLYQQSQVEIGERKKTQENLQFLAQADEILASSLDYKSSFKDLAKELVSRVADFCSLDILDDEGKINHLGMISKDQSQAIWSEPFDISLLDSSKVIVDVLQKGTLKSYKKVDGLLLKNITYSEKERNRLMKSVFESAVILPLRAHNKIFGAVTFLKQETKFSRLDLALAKNLAHRAALSVENANLHKQVKDSRDRLDIILKGVGEGILVQDLAGNVAYANDAMARLSGYSSVSELTQKSISDLYQKFEITDEDGNRLLQEDFPRRVALLGKDPPEMTIRYRQIGATEDRWAVIKITPVFDENERVRLTITIIRDVTDKIIVEKRKDEFISIASHELKTPLTNIKIFAQMLEKRLNKTKDKNISLYLSKINSKADLINKLIGDLLDISKIRAGKWPFYDEVFYFDDLVSEVITDLAHTSTNKIIKKGQTRKYILADRSRIAQALTNLISNAIKFSFQNTSVIVSLSAKNGKVFASVRDFGVGISKETQSKLFEPFFQGENTKESFGGLGLGLYIASEVIRHYGERITVKSREGKGSIFTFALPIKRK